MIFWMVCIVESRVGRPHKKVDERLIAGWFKKSEMYIENDMKTKIG